MLLIESWLRTFGVKLCYYNYQRPHFGSNMNGKTPMEALKCYKWVIIKL